MVQEQFSDSCSKDLSVYLIERMSKDLDESLGILSIKHTDRSLEIISDELAQQVEGKHGGGTRKSKRN